MRPRPVRVDQAPAGESGGTDAARWREAARLRREFRGWVVVWLAREGCFRAYRRMPGARRDTALSAASTDEMSVQIRQAEQAKARPARHAPDPA